MRIRPAHDWDQEKIREIYNYEVLHGTATFDIKQRNAEDHKTWWTAHKSLPVFVVEDGELVVAWAALTKWSPRAGYDRSLEVSIYVAEGFRGKGIGNLLLAELENAAKASGVHCLLARITADNAISVKMHEKQGFFRAGLLREVGFKFEKWHDVIVMQKLVV